MTEQERATMREEVSKLVSEKTKQQVLAAAQRYYETECEKRTKAA